MSRGLLSTIAFVHEGLCLYQGWVNSQGIGINQFNSKSNSGIGVELELKDFEREELELKKKLKKGIGIEWKGIEHLNFL